MIADISRPRPDQIDPVIARSAAFYPDRPEERGLWEQAAEGQAPALVAIANGEVIGYASGRPEPGLAPGIFRIGLGVAVPHRRQGIGSRLLDQILADLAGCTEVRIRVPDSAREALAFLQRRGFREHQRMLQLVQDLTALAEPPVTPPPPGIAITTLAEERAARPDCLEAIHELRNGCFLDIPSGDTVTLPTLESFLEFMQHPAILPEGFFLAKAGDRYVGLSYVGRRPGDATTLNHHVTGVHREFRGRGVATALKREVTRYAMAQGYQRVITHTLAANVPMRAVNAALGFCQEYAEIRLQRLLEPGGRA